MCGVGGMNVYVCVCGGGGGGGFIIWLLRYIVCV